jgi:hypothetical protein
MYLYAFSARQLNLELLLTSIHTRFYQLKKPPVILQKQALVQEPEWALWIREISFAQLGKLKQVNYIFYYYIKQLFSKISFNFFVLCVYKFSRKVFLF